MAVASLVSADADSAALSAVQAATQEIAMALDVARRLVAAGHRVDLAGIDDMVGKVCAKALDLPPAFGRQAVPALTALRTGLDALNAALDATAQSPPQGKRPGPCAQNPYPTLVSDRRDS